MDAELENHTDDTENDRRRLEERLSRALEENRLLHERLADLDIALNMDTVELKRAIEELTGERDNLIRENEFLLEDYTSRDYRIQELLRELEIKQLMIHETSSYLSTATDRIRNLERQCAGLASSLHGEDASAERDGDGHLTLIEEIRREAEEALGQRDAMGPGTAAEDIVERQPPHQPDADESPQGGDGGRDGHATLEHTLMDMEHSLAVLERRLSHSSQSGTAEQDDIMLKLDDAQREIFSLRECHRSLLEVLKRSDEEARRAGPSFTEAEEPDPVQPDPAEIGREMLDAEIADLQEHLRNRESELDLLRAEASESAAEALAEKSRLEQKLADSEHAFEERLKTSEARIAELEAALSVETRRNAEIEEVLSRNEIVLKEMHEQFLSDSDRLSTESDVIRTRYEQTCESLATAEHSRKDLEADVRAKEGRIAELTERIMRQQQEEEAAKTALSRAEEALKMSEAEASRRKAELLELNDRLTRTVTNGEMNEVLTARLDEILEGVRRRQPETLPVVASPLPVNGNTRSRLPAIVSAIAAAAIILGLAAGLGMDRLRTLASGKIRNTAAAPGWSVGVKQARTAAYEIGLTFLNREAVHVLGFDDLVSDAMLGKETIALLVVKSTGRCIPDAFVESPERNLRFMDRQNGREPLISHDAFSAWKKTVYKRGACGNGQPGVVYLKHLIATPRQPGINGLEIRGLEEGPVLLR